MKHIIKHTFLTTLTPEERDKLPKFKRYWSLYNLTMRKPVKYRSVEGSRNLDFLFTLEEGKYLVSNAVDRYVLEVHSDGNFEVKELNEKVDYTQYLFTD